MKQRITIEDLNTLTVEQKKRLQKWWKPKQGDYALSAENNNQSNGKTVVLSTVAKHPREFYGEKGVFVAFFVYENKDNGHMGNLDKLYPLLSIGQMMQYIRDRKAHDIVLSELLWFESVTDVLWYNVKKLLATDKTGGEEDAEVDDE